MNSFLDFSFAQPFYDHVIWGFAYFFAQGMLFGVVISHSTSPDMPASSGWILGVLSIARVYCILSPSLLILIRG